MNIMNPKTKLAAFRQLPSEEKRRAISEFFINNLLYILLIGAIVGIQIYDPRFLSVSSIVKRDFHSGVF